MEPKDKREFKQLFDSYLSGNYTDKDLSELITYFQLEESCKALEEALEEFLVSDEAYTKQEKDRIAKILSGSDEKVYEGVTAKSNKAALHWVGIAAAILVSISIGISIYWYSNREIPRNELRSTYGGDVLPGTNRARLTLSDGTSLPLDETKQGVIVNWIFC